MQVIKPDINKLTTRDRYPLLRNYWQIQSYLKQNKNVDKLIDNYKKRIKESSYLVTLRKKKLPKENLHNRDKKDLPIISRWDEIANVIKNNQVTIICGHTGSGKTTQIPQICLDINLGARGKIAHTQPRRIAARTLAARISEELDTTLGKEIGYKVRFDEKNNKDTIVLLQTEGMLLNEIQQDKFLNNYEVIIIDEAHERSLNIDFLLGYLRQLLPKRPDLKIIITSATIDPQSFANHFTIAGKSPPIVDIEGKTFPIKILYRPVTDSTDNKNNENIIDGICRAVTELDNIHYGDSLIFLPTERDIREAKEALEKLNLANTEILSLFSRQTATLQHAIFHPQSKRRIILSTNVAETSVTVPRILNVIDTGIARISRYSHKSKIQRLPIETISQASADQRKGRCGRIADGVCIRLYSEEDYLSRPEFTEPEIKRTSLASIILQMSIIGLGKIDDFPFIDPPEYKMIADGYKLLFELQAVDKKQKISKLGYKMAKLPIDPRFAAILIFAKNHSILDRLLPIICALVVGDIKERPYEYEQQADTAHNLFAHKQSDFLFFTNVFAILYPLFKKSKNKAKKWAKKHFLSIMRIREWIFLIEQLAEQLDHKITNPDSNIQDINQYKKDNDRYINEYKIIHTAIIVGFLDHIGCYKPEENSYFGVRNKRFYTFPGSFLFKKQYKHIVCAEIVESSRVYARQVAKIDFTWLEPLCTHLTKTIESEPVWSKKQGRVIAKQTVLLYGLPILTDKMVAYDRIQPQVAHDIFVRSALVENTINTTVPEIAKNHDLYNSLLELEEKSRSRNILIDEQSVAKLYFALIPETVFSEVTLKAWYKKIDLNTKKRLSFSKSDLLLDNNHGIDNTNYPDFLLCHEQRLKLTYEFDPTSKRDGITVIIPLANLNAFSELDFDYLIPAMLDKKIIALIKSLPKRYRRQFVPVSQYVDIILAKINNDKNKYNESLIEKIIAVLKQQKTFKLTADLFNIDKLDKHYFMNIAVIDKHRKIIAESRNLAQLQERFYQDAGNEFDFNTRHIFRQIFTDSFPQYIDKKYKVKDKKLIAYPALVAVDDGYKIKLFDSFGKAQYAHNNGVLSFIKKDLNKEIRYIKKQIINNHKISLLYKPLLANNKEVDLLDDIINALLLHSHLLKTPYTNKSYQDILLSAKKNIIIEAQQLTKVLLTILTNYHKAKKMMAVQFSYFNDIDAQLKRIIYAGFISKTPSGRLPDIARYLQGIVIRLNKAHLDIKKDAKWQTKIEPFSKKLIDKIGNSRLDKNLPTKVLNYAYLLEEYRLSVFAQDKVKIIYKVSEKRLLAAELEM